MDREKYLRLELERFIHKHDANASISCIDEIVLNYIVSVLEELGQANATEDEFDVDDFSQMMEAYIPSFNNLDSIAISEWMFYLASKLSTLEWRKADTLQPDENDHEVEEKDSFNYLPAMDFSSFDEEFRLESECESTAQDQPNVSSDKMLSCRQKTSSSQSSCSTNGQGDNQLGEESESSGSNVRSEQSSSQRSSASGDGFESVNESLAACAIDDCLEKETDFEIGLLLEMFPSGCPAEAKHCMCVCHDNIEEAAQLMLLRQETGLSFSAANIKRQQLASSKGAAAHRSVSDDEVKKHIVDKYFYVDVDDDKKEHRPVVKSQGSKKMVRYLDGRIVSTKGERFTEVKSAEDEEKMKKTFINLKPARQYRFH